MKISTMKVRAGPRNLITDVDGILVGNAENHAVKTGSTVLYGEQPFTANVHVMGGAPGTRETDLLEADKLVSQVDALVLSGGSAFGLDAASHVATLLRSEDRGLAVDRVKVPIVPAAILFDLLNGGDQNWVKNPWFDLGGKAFHAKGRDFDLGSVGVGFGATTADLKGGLGSASIALENGISIGALVAVNSLGSVIQQGSPHFWAAYHEMDEEFGGFGPSPNHIDISDIPSKMNRRDVGEQAANGNTTIAIVATDAALDKAQCKRMAVAAHDGMARAIWPSHTPFDGDLVFALGTGTQPALPESEMMALGHYAAVCLARAIARAVWHATPAEGDLLPTFAEKFGVEKFGL